MIRVIRPNTILIRTGRSIDNNKNTVRQRFIYLSDSGCDSRLKDSRFSAFGRSFCLCSMGGRLEGLCPEVDNRIPEYFSYRSVVWFLFRDRYPVTDRSRVSNISVPIRTTRHGVWAVRGSLFSAIRSESSRFGVLGLFTVKFKDKVNSDGAGKLPCLCVFDINQWFLFLVCHSEQWRSVAWAK